jgi:uncharacterized membrane protein
MLAGQLALVAAALFAGAALYVGAVEHPARRHLDDAGQLAEWKPAYARGAIMQASLAIVGFLLGLTAWWQTGNWLWLYGGIVLAANWPYTLLVIMPTNNLLKATDPAHAGPQTRALLEKWAMLHAIRTTLGLAATAIFVFAAIR